MTDDPHFQFGQYAGQVVSNAPTENAAYTALARAQIRLGILTRDTEWFIREVIKPALNRKFNTLAPVGASTDGTGEKA